MKQIRKIRGYSYDFDDKCAICDDEMSEVKWTRDVLTSFCVK